MHLASQSLREFISQIFRYPNSSSQDEATEGRVRVEQINAIKRYLTWILVANVCNALVLVAALWTSTLRPLAAAWAAAVIILCFHFGIRQLRTAGARPTHVSTRTVTRAIINSLLLTRELVG
jgi:diguanylate cyclase